MNDVFKRANKLGYIMFPISCYEHGNVCYSLGTSSGWDSGTVGVAFVTKKDICEWFCKKRISAQLIEKTKEIFESELNTYTQWCNGDVYGFSVVDSMGNDIDSCWGFYGLCLDTDLEEAKNSGLLNSVADCTGSGEPEDWREAEVEYIVYKNKTV